MVKELVKLSSEVVWKWKRARWGRKRHVDQQVPTIWHDVLAEGLGNKRRVQEHGMGRERDSEATEIRFKTGQLE